MKADTSQDSPALRKLESELLSNLPKGVSAFVLMLYSENSPLTEVWRFEGSRECGASGDAKRVQNICCKRQRPVLIHDAEKDAQMKGIKVRSFRSALCVPIFDENKGLIGAIFVCSPEPGVFQNDHRYAVERLAREYGPALTSLRKVPTEEVAGKTETSILFLPWVLGSAAMAFLLLTVWLLAPSAPEPVPRKTLAPQSLENRAGVVAEQFLKELKSENYERAWRLLAPELQREWSVARFSSELSGWIHSVDNREILENRELNRIQRQNRTAQVVLLESSVRGDRGHWRWELREDGGVWRITSVEGPVTI